MLSILNRAPRLVLTTRPLLMKSHSSSSSSSTHHMKYDDSTPKVIRIPSKTLYGPMRLPNEPPLVGHSSSPSAEYVQSTFVQRLLAKHNVDSVPAFTKKYGVFFVGSYVAVRIGFIGALATILSLPGIEGASIVNRLLSDYADAIDLWFGVDVEKINPKAGALASAWVLDHLFGPLHVIFAIWLTPIARRLFDTRQIRKLK